MMSFPVVGVGASAGGIEALTEFVGALDATCNFAVLIVQHSEPHRHSLLPELLAAQTPLKVSEGGNERVVLPGHIYVTPAGAVMTVHDGRLVLTPVNDADTHVMPIDTLFYSLADEEGPNAVGVVLSGMGSDGALGLQAIKHAGGFAFAQDEASARFHGMPAAAMELHAVDRILPPREIARALQRLVAHPYCAAHQREAGTAAELSIHDEEMLRRILRRLKVASGVDFSHYKRGTIKRRLARRMAIRGCDSLQQYLALLESAHDEPDCLFRDLLIQVTQFFRDPEVFDGLVNTVMPRLLEQRAPDQPLRIWVPGCASGEEVYSLAIAIVEYLDQQALKVQVQLFGTDLSEVAIEVARNGIYPGTIARSVSDDRLRRFFIKIDGQYRISRSIRDLCVFAAQNVVEDPPFSRLDMISCRNLLIYLEPSLQGRVMRVFHYALKPGGFLFLGPSESVGAASDLFNPVDKRLRIFARKLLPERDLGSLLEHYDAVPNPQGSRKGAGSIESAESGRLGKEADRVAMERYVPPGILCDADLNILEFRGDTTPFLGNPVGPPSNKLQKLVRPGLLVELSNAVAESRKHGSVIRREGLHLAPTDNEDTVAFEVRPLRLAGEEALWFLVFFERQATGHRDGANRPEPFWQGLGQLFRSRPPSPSAAPDEKDLEIKRLVYELESTRSYMRGVMDSHEATVEELKAAEEELLSSNEEYQSTNEELETAQEELQSSIDELRARNRELNTLNDELLNARDLSESIVETIHQPLLVLDSELRVQQANRAFYSLFQTRPEQTQKVRLYDLGQGQWALPELKHLLEEVLPAHEQFQDRELTITFPKIGQRTLRLNGQALRWKQPECILLAIEDITEHRSVLEALTLADRRKDEFLAMLAHELRNPLAPIRTALDIWRRGTTDAAVIRQAQDMLDRQLQQESRLIDDLLDLSRITQGAIQLRQEVVDLAALSEAVVADERPQADAHGQQLELSIPTHPVIVRGDPVRLRQIVLNLLTNAIKYTPTAGVIRISLVRAGGEARLDVTDTGIGIDAALIGSVFDLFVQADKSLARTEGGLGIGLTLVRRLVELHGGRVAVFSEGLGCGSRFTVRLPCLPDGPPLPQPEAPAEEPAVTPHPRRILVVDDNADAAESLALLLRSDGHETQVTFDGQSAVEMAKTFLPDTVLLDIGLPGLNGYEVAQQLRAMEALKATVLIAISGYGQIEDLAKSKAAGFDQHLVKPVSYDRLRSLMARYP